MTAERGIAPQETDVQDDPTTDAEMAVHESSASRIDVADVLFLREDHRAHTFVARVARADDAVLVALARQARRAPRPPAFYGRSLDPAFLDAVASGQWTPADQGRLRAVQSDAEAAGLHRVPRRHRRSLRRALRATAVCVLTEGVASAAWQHRRDALARAWACTVGPLPSV